MDTITSRDDLIRYTDAGGTVKYLPFWGHTPRRDGQLGASCLSQWWPSPFTVAGIRYATAEHWMMAGKARLSWEPVNASWSRPVPWTGSGGSVWPGTMSGSAIRCGGGG